MQRIYRFAAAVLVALGGFAAIGVGALIVATAIIIGVVAVLAAKLAIKGRVQETPVDAPFDADRAPV